LFFVKKILRNISLITLVVVTLMGCSSPKRVYNYTAGPTHVGKFYHNLTSRYNAYFNARILLKESEQTLANNYKDNFNKQLSLYPYAANSDTNSVSSNVKTIQEKCGVDITLHRDKSKWVDNCYLLFGKSAYLVKDYEKAISAYDYIISNYNPDKPRKVIGKKKKKKKRRKPFKQSYASSKKKKKKKSSAKEKKTKKNPYFLLHKPSIIEAKLLKAQALIELNESERAKILLDDLQRDTLYKKADKQLAVLQAYHQIERGDFLRARNAVEKAVEINKNKHVRARLYYIMGQLAQDQEKYALSNEFFDKSSKYKSSFELDFNVQINQIKNQLAQSSNYGQARKDLKQLLRDQKNNEYKDQIYYNLGVLYMLQEDYVSAESNFLLSLEENNDNKIQRAETYLSMAELKYIQKQYSPSKSYYDSTLLVIDPFDERIELIQSYSDNLKNISDREDLIALNDSLIRISKLNPEGQRLLASKLSEEGNKPSTIAGNAVASVTSTFWAFDEKQKKKSNRDFRRVWGDIAVQDDWRRSSSNSGFGSSRNNSVVSSAVDAPVLSDSEMEEVLSAVPRNEQSVLALDSLTEATLLDLANLYELELQDVQSSIEAYENILERYPKSKNKEKVLYTLYRKHEELGNTVKAAHYKKLLVDYNPDSEYAILADDPNRALLRELSEKEFDDHDREIAVKVDFLKALLAGKLNGKDAYIEALKNVVFKYPNTPESETASEYIAILTEDPNKQVEDPVASFEDSADLTFKFNKSERHFILMIPQADAKQMFKLRQELIKFNETNYTKKKLFTSSATINKGQSILLIRQFKNEGEATEYLSFVDGKDVRKDVFTTATPYEVYVIGRSDFSKLLKEKNLTLYLEEYKRVYK